MKVLFGWFCSLYLGALTISFEPYFEDTNLVLEEDVLGFNGQPYGLYLSVFEKSLLQPYFNGILDFSRGKLFHYGEPKAIFTQSILEGQAGYSIPLNRRDIFRFTPFSGLGVYYQKLQGWDKTISFYVPLGILHASLAVRVLAEWAGAGNLVAWSGFANVLALLTFLASTVWAIFEAKK